MVRDDHDGRGAIPGGKTGGAAAAGRAEAIVDWAGTGATGPASPDEAAPDNCAGDGTAAGCGDQDGRGRTPSGNACAAATDGRAAGAGAADATGLFISAGVSALAAGCFVASGETACSGLIAALGATAPVAAVTDFASPGTAITGRDARSGLVGSADGSMAAICSLAGAAGAGIDGAAVSAMDDDTGSGRLVSTGGGVAASGATVKASAWRGRAGSWRGGSMAAICWLACAAGAEVEGAAVSAMAGGDIASGRLASAAEGAIGSAALAGISRDGETALA